MMTYTQPSSYNHASFLPKSGNRRVSEKRYYDSPSSTSSHGSFSLNTSSTHPRTLTPYLSVQRASEPASPATVATTISSHSTPSPSPSRNTNMRNGSSSNQDFILFDDAIIAAAQDLNGKGRSVIDVPTSNSGLSQYAPNGFPVIVPHDVSYSNYASSGVYFPSGYSTADAASNLYNITENGHQVPHNQQQNKYLPQTSYNSTPLANTYAHSQSGNVEEIENVPALSHVSRQSGKTSPVRNKLSSGRHSPPQSLNRKKDAQSERPSPLYNSAPTAYMQSAMPKLGRTISDAVQDELYNPELIHQSEQKLHQQQQQQQQKKGKSMQSHLSTEVKSETRNPFPHIFQEAQQQHQQCYSQPQTTQSHLDRERSPFRNNSPFHPTNATYNIPLDSDRSLHQSQINHQALDQNHQMVMAMALCEQAEQASAPKTISPRDALLEYHGPESQHSQMNLFPSLQPGRAVPHDDALSNASLHHSSHDGSDVDDFQSMATSRRASIANSSASSHLDVARLGYMHQQTSYDNVPTSSYYYNDANSLANSLSVGSTATVPFVKEEMDYTPIQRPTDTSANTGTYTCTYTGCGQRFTNSTKLQKHRRDNHRKSAASGNSVSTAAAIASRNAQPGPHRCMRINPSTGKPCNTVFSRPYDLTRHEDTIHNRAKEKTRCEICNDEKTFSRADALVRHRRVKHGIH